MHTQHTYTHTHTHTAHTHTQHVQHTHIDTTHATAQTTAQTTIYKYVFVIESREASFPSQSHVLVGLTL